MARKHGIREKIVQPSPQQLEEWDAILGKELGMGRGNRNWLTYVGTGRELEALHGAIQEDTGKVKGR
jgi:hypothetical protein